MGDGKVERRRIRRVEGKPAMTPEMLWPVREPARVRGAEHPGVSASRMGHPSVRAGRSNGSSTLAASPGPRVILGKGRDLVDLSDCGNRCGEGVWCEACRADIRAEALRWLRELNVPRPSRIERGLLWSRAWNRELLLADH